MKKKYFFIYKTTNLKNGKFYVGMHSTDNLNDGYLGSGKVLRNSVYYHGKNNFKREILEFCENIENLSKRENELVNNDLIKQPKCMNLVVGGYGGRFKNEEHRYKFHANGGRKVREIFREKHLVNLKNNSEYRERWFRNYHESMKHRIYDKDNHFFNKKHSDETKRKIGLNNSLKQKGEYNSQYGTCWITNGIKNMKIKRNDEIPNGWYRGRIIMK